MFVVVQAGYDLALLGQSRLLGQIVTESREFQRISVKVSDIAGDHYAIEVVPGPRADAVARVDRRLTRPRLRAEVGPPSPAARADGFGERLAVSVRAFQATEIAAVADRLRW